MHRKPLLREKKRKKSELESKAKIIRNRCCEKHRFFCDRMDEFQLKRVQGLSLDPAVILVIQIVPGKGMADILHVNTNLVGTPCFQMKFHK